VVTGSREWEPKIWSMPDAPLAEVKVVVSGSESREMPFCLQVAQDVEAVVGGL